MVVVVGAGFLTRLPLTTLLILVVAILVLVLVDFVAAVPLEVEFRILRLDPKHLIWSIGWWRFVVLVAYFMIIMR